MFICGGDSHVFVVLIVIQMRRRWCQWKDERCSCTEKTTNCEFTLFFSVSRVPLDKTNCRSHETQTDRPKTYSTDGSQAVLCVWKGRRQLGKVQKNKAHSTLTNIGMQAKAWPSIHEWKCCLIGILNNQLLVFMLLLGTGVHQWWSCTKFLNMFETFNAANLFISSNLVQNQARSDTKQTSVSLGC